MTATPARRRGRTPRQRQTSRTFTAWLAYFQTELEARDSRPATLRMYRQRMRQVVAFFGDVPPETLTPERVEAWKDDMLSRGLMPSTINAYLLSLGAFLNWLIAEGVLTESPVLAVALVKHRDISAPPVFDQEALNRIIKGARRGVKTGRDKFTVLRDEVVVSLLADTGMRATECAKTQLDDLNLAARQIRVRAEVTKGRYERTVTFGFQTARVLGRYLRARDAHRLAFLPEVFLTQQGAMTYKTMHVIVNEAGKAAGVIGARPHLLRHTWAHDLKSRGIDTEVLMSLGGWRSFDMPMRYGRSAKQERAIAAYQRLGSTVDRAGVTSNRNSGTPANHTTEGSRHVR